MFLDCYRSKTKLKMIQELFGGATNINNNNNNNSSFIEGERKISSFNQQVAAVVLQQSPTSLLSSSSPNSSTPIITTTSTTVTTTTTTTSENQNLRCPRCDSSNTKFCYYNNYNLTQPRHFCKTCRRYWTKGGALRNVPIGGGCRKNRNSSGMPNPIAKASSSKMKGVASSELGKSTTLGPLLDDHDHELPLPPTLPILWGSPQNTTNFLAFLRANQNQNPNPSPSSSTPMTSSIVSHVKELFEEGKQQPRSSSSSSSQYNMVSTHQQQQQQPLLSSNGLVLSTMNPRISYDGVGQVPFWRNNNHQDQIQRQNINNIGFVLGGEQFQSSSSGTGIQQLDQKLRSTSSPSYCSSSTNNYNSTIIQGNMASSLSNIFDSSSSDQFGCWNPTLSWSDNLPTTNAASYPS